MRSFAIALPILVAACSNAKPTAARPPVAVQRTELRAAAETGEPSAAAPDRAVVARIQFRDHVLVIRPGAGELLYDMQTRAGVLVHRDLSREELERLFPEIADQVRDSVAFRLDATLHREVEKPFGR